MQKGIEFSHLYATDSESQSVSSLENDTFRTAQAFGKVYED